MDAQKRSVFEQFIILQQRLWNGDGPVVFEVKNGIASFGFAVNDFFELEYDKALECRQAQPYFCRVAYFAQVVRQHVCTLTTAFFQSFNPGSDNQQAQAEK